MIPLEGVSIIIITLSAILRYIICFNPFNCSFSALIFIQKPISELRCKKVALGRPHAPLPRRDSYPPVPGMTRPRILPPIYYCYEKAYEEAGTSPVVAPGSRVPSNPSKRGYGKTRTVRVAKVNARATYTVTKLHRVNVYGGTVNQ